MMDSGILDGSILHPIHLWPRRFNPRPKAVRNRFDKGGLFTTANGEFVRVYDLPPRTKVVLHCNIRARLEFSLSQ